MEAITNDVNIIDSRDVIGRIVELECYSDSGAASEDETEELVSLMKLASQCENEVADWQYGETLVRDSYWVDYAKQLHEDISQPLSLDYNGQTPWPYRHINWDDAADELQSDYFDVDFDGVTYWTR